MGTEYTLYKVNKPEYYDLGKHLCHLDYMALLNYLTLREAQATEKWNRKPFNLRKAWESFAAFYDDLVKITGFESTKAFQDAAKALWDWAKDDDLILLSDDEDSKTAQALFLGTSGHSLNCCGQFLIYDKAEVKVTDGD